MFHSIELADSSLPLVSILLTVSSVKFLLCICQYAEEKFLWRRIFKVRKQIQTWRAVVWRERKKEILRIGIEKPNRFQC